MSIDLAKTLALREQAGAYKPTAGLALGIVTAYDDDDWTVTVTVGNGPIIVPRLRSYTSPNVDDAVLLARSGSAVYCLGALNLNPVEPPVDPDPQPPPPPPPLYITQTFRAESTGWFAPRATPQWSTPGGDVPQGDIGSAILAMLGDFETDTFDGWSLNTDAWNYLVGPLEDWYLPPFTGTGYMVASARASGTGPVYIGSTIHQSVNDPVSVAVRVNASTGSRVRLVVIPDTGSALTLDRTITWGRWTPIILDVPDHGGGYTVELYSLDPWVGQAVHVDAVAEVERQAGAVYYGEGPSTLGGTAVTGSLRIRRLGGGIPVPWQPVLRLLSERTRPATGPGSPIGDPLTGPLLAVGETVDLALPLAWVAALLSGTAGGIAPDPSGDPMWLAGRDSYTAAFDLTLTRNGEA